MVQEYQGLESAECESFRTSARWRTDDVECTTYMTSHPGSEKVLWVINESRAYPMSDGERFDGSVVHVDCDPLERQGT
jgi:hypothetical protein